MTKAGFVGSVMMMFAVVSSGAGAAIVNSPIPIEGVVTINPIIVANDDGSNQATFFGNSDQQMAIEGVIDQIWAQAGIDIEFLPPVTYNNTFANEGTSGLAARPRSDLDVIVADAEADGITHLDPMVLNLFLVSVSPGHPPLSPNHVGGLGFVGANGITQYVGANLVSFGAGQEVTASVVAHEIGHNLGLEHIVESENLMQMAGTTPAGERLNETQIAKALASPFVAAVQPVPLPAGVWLLASAGVGLGMWRRRGRSGARPSC